MTWTREDLEALKTLDRPRVRCRISVRFVNEEGRTVDTCFQDRSGLIVIDGNNPWIDLGTIAGVSCVERFSWGLVLDVLNDPTAAPVFLSAVPVFNV